MGTADGPRCLGVAALSHEAQLISHQEPDRRTVVAALGITQILAWGSTFYLMGVLVSPIALETGWGYGGVISGVSIALLTAGAISPLVGTAISRWGGRRVLTASAIVLAAGLALIGSSPTLELYIAAWVILGIGMGAGLTDAAFSTLGNIYGDKARSAITSLTLFAGFASTVSWPLSAWLLEHLGWRGTYFVYAAIQIGVALPVLLLALPRHPIAAAPLDEHHAAPARARLARGELSRLLLLAVVLTLSAAILSMMGVHLLPLLQARGLELSAAVWLGALVGPAQVAARVIEMIAGRYYQPIWTMVASAVLVAVGAGLLYLDFPAYSMAIVLYGAGNGMGSVARGTLPLSLFGPGRYPVLMGRLGLPILMAMALSPMLGAIAFQAGGAGLTLRLLVSAAAANVLFMGLLWILSRWRTNHAGS